MKTGMNLLLWSTHVTQEHFPLIAKLKQTGFDGVEIPLFEGDANHYKAREIKNNGLGCITETCVGPDANPISPDAKVRQEAVEGTPIWEQTVFLSSTASDMTPYRKVAFRVISACGFHCVRMEDFGALDSGAEDYCVQEVAKCDLFVGLLGHWYGSTPPGKKRSFSELEYRAAAKAGVPRLMFLTPEDLLVPANQIEPEVKRERLRRFRRAVLLEHVCDSYFATPEDLAIRLIQALRPFQLGVARNSRTLQHQNDAGAPTQHA